MYKTNLTESAVVKMGNILQSRDATKEDVLAAYAEAEYDCIEDNDEASETHTEEQQ